MTDDIHSETIPPDPAADGACAANGHASPNGEAPAHGTSERLRRLPPEVGAVLLAVGVVGVLVPGPVGTPLLLAGGLALMPGVFGRFERWVERKYPAMHNEGMKHVGRFVDDLEKRYPP
jgi:hypothetical protein